MPASDADLALRKIDWSAAVVVPAVASFRPDVRERLAGHDTPRPRIFVGVISPKLANREYECCLTSAGAHGR